MSATAEKLYEEHAPDEETVSIRSLAVQSLENYETLEDAVRALREMAMQNRPIYDALTEPLLDQACYDAVRAVCRQERRSIWTAPGYTAGGNGERVQAHAASLMDMMLPGGKRMRDAKRVDLEAAADFYRKQAKTMQHFADWLTAIAEKVGRAKVGSKFTEAKLRELQQAVSND